MKQTAVEWFARQLGITSGTMLKQAKTMEREHIEDAYQTGYANHMNDEGNFDQYYNETYGGKQ